MSSSSNISGLLAELINGTTETSASPASVRNLNPVSFSTSHHNSQIKELNSRTTPQINATKKAIVLKHALATPIVVSSAGSGTGWFATMKDLLPSYGVSETITGAISATGITNYPRYYIWILPDNTNSDNAIPVLKNRKVSNIDIFQLCSIKDTSMTEELVEGALIRIDFENRLLKSDAYVVNIMNNTEEFGRAIFTELEGITSAADACAPCGDERPSVSHPTGDSIPAAGGAAALHDAYVLKNRAAGANETSAASLYSILESRLGDASLALGILANAKAESNFDANVVSGVATESSLGLWQMNVQSEGRVSVPKSSMTTQASSLPQSIRIPSSSSVIVYFAGGQLAKKNGVSVITPTDYASGNQDVGEVYEIVTDPTKQLEYVIEVAQSMLATITYNAADITAGDWAQWWQIYFEQPASIHNRREHAAALGEDLSLSVVV
tara:strand:- start:835 stop:2157 length:1323 start_codon:yes stop_codon:yes gene_type:complete